MGTFDTRFVIPDTAGLKSSPIIWAAAEKVNHKTLEANPLVVNGEKVIPRIKRVFRGDQNLYVIFDVYDPVLDLAAQAPAIGVRAEQIAGTRPDVVPVQLWVPLNGLTPGRVLE